jgi:succinate dehydrogenase/fumarate reductase flavoprotein subunit
VVRAGAVVIATGGCAFLSRALGCNVLTGDGQLMAAEVGASLSGMEFSNAYGLGPAFSSVTKSLFYNWATFYTADGSGDRRGGLVAFGRSVIAKTLADRSRCSAAWTGPTRRSAPGCAPRSPTSSSRSTVRASTRSRSTFR